MNILLWVLQVLAALLYGASGVMKVFMFDKVSEQAPSFGALPREAHDCTSLLRLTLGRQCTRSGMPVFRRKGFAFAFRVSIRPRHQCRGKSAFMPVCSGEGVGIGFFQAVAI
jgi:hypothetical protein